MHASTKARLILESVQGPLRLVSSISANDQKSPSAPQVVTKDTRESCVAHESAGSRRKRARESITHHNLKTCQQPNAIVQVRPTIGYAHAQHHSHACPPLLSQVFPFTFNTKSYPAIEADYRLRRSRASSRNSATPGGKGREGQEKEAIAKGRSGVSCTQDAVCAQDDAGAVRER
jgi:hypothetical protein